MNLCNDGCPSCMSMCNTAVIRCRDLIFRTMNSGTSASWSGWTTKSMCRCFFKVENWDLFWLELQAAPREMFWWFLKRCQKTRWNYWESSAHPRAASELTNTLQNDLNLKFWLHLRGLLKVFFWIQDKCVSSFWKMKDRGEEWDVCEYKSGECSGKTMFWLVFDQINSVIHSVRQHNLRKAPRWLVLP